MRSWLFRLSFPYFGSSIIIIIKNDMRDAGGLHLFFRDQGRPNDSFHQRRDRYRRSSALSTPATLLDRSQIRFARVGLSSDLRTRIKRLSKDKPDFLPPRTHTFPMRSQQYTPSPLLLALALVSVLSAVSFVSASPASGDDFLDGIIRRDGHGHHNPHSAPLIELNETEVTMYHALTPPSYYTFDWESPGEPNRHPGLLMTHAVFMCTAFFIALPIGKSALF